MCTVLQYCTALLYYSTVHVYCTTLVYSYTAELGSQAGVLVYCMYYRTELLYLNQYCDLDALEDLESPKKN